MNYFRHECPDCKYKDCDGEVLTVCPDCASNKITNEEVPTSKVLEEKATIN